MKILYAIQGTGNGHLSRANDIVPILQAHSDLDILVSGIQADVDIPYDIKYRLNGLSFIFGKKGGVDLWNTFKKARTLRLYKEIRDLPVENYDLVINDFEPVSAWACKLRKVSCIGLSHQAAVMHPNAPKPKKGDKMGESILKNYAPSDQSYGFHFKSYSQDIYTPVIRKQIRELNPRVLGHYTVYLPSYGDDKIIKVLSEFKTINWQVFSKHCKNVYQSENVSIFPVDNTAFIKSMETCTGILCGAGFETPAEALFLGKKLLVIPMKSQYEQQCNAAALKEMGVPVIKNLKSKRVGKIREWIESPERVQVDYPDVTEEILLRIMDKTPVFL